MKMNKIILSVALFFTAATISAQENQLLHVDLGTGLHTLQGKANDGDHGPQMGYTFNLGYRYFIDAYWGVGAGLGLSSYAGKTTFNFVEQSEAFDPNVWAGGSNYSFNTYYKNFVEKQKVTQLEIPIVAYYCMRDISRGWDFVSNIGFKIGVPVVKKYKLKDGMYETKGYYDSVFVELDTLPNHGFYVVEANKQKIKSQCKNFSLSICGEAGLQRVISKGVYVYGGVYFSYSLLSLAQNNNKPLVSPNGTYNGTMASNQCSHANPLQFGVKASLLVNFNKVRQILHLQTRTKF